MTAPHGRSDSPDALGRVAGFAHTLRLPVLGIPVRFETNDARVVVLVEQAFARWRTLELPPHRGDECSVRITVEPGEESVERARLRYRVGEDGYVLLTTSASAGYADPLRREVRAWVTDRLVDDAQHFRYGVIEGLTIALLSRLDRQPVHAAAIVRDGVALLLAGRSGAGKSTLAYAAACAGLDVLAEDVVYVQLAPRLRVWGASSYLHLPAESARFFAHLAAAESVQLANGKRKLVVDLRRDAPGAVEPFADRAGVCILRRGEGTQSSVRALSPAEVARALGDGLEQGFDLFRGTITAAHAALASPGGWELTVGGEPAGQVPALRDMLAALRARS